MKLIKQLLAIASIAFIAAGPAVAGVDEKPDVLVKRISQDVIDTAKADKDIQAGNRNKVIGLVEEKIMPHVDFMKTTSMAAGRFWRQATPEQREKLSAEFKTLLIYTYSGAISQIKNETVQFKPMRAQDSDTDAEVRSQVNMTRGEPITLNYRLYKTPDGWKIYDINVYGAWLVETYKSSFASQINSVGIDGLIANLAAKNKMLANKPLKAPK